jgi:hypothetical protein
MTERHMPRPKWEEIVARVGPTVDLINKSLQIVALLIGGIWAAWTWNQLNAPGLETGLSTNSDGRIRWDADAGACSIAIVYGIANNGLNAIHVTRVHYRIMSAPVERLQGSEKIRVISTIVPQDAKVLVEANYSDDFLLHVYPPKSQSTEGLNLLVVPPAPGEEYWFDISAYGNKSDGPELRLGLNGGVLEGCKRPVAALTPGLLQTPIN